MNRSYWSAVCVVWFLCQYYLIGVFIEIVITDEIGHKLTIKAIVSGIYRSQTPIRIAEMVSFFQIWKRTYLLLFWQKQNSPYSDGHSGGVRQWSGLCEKQFICG